MRVCVIFNPTARGNKARRFRRHLDDMASQSVFRATTAPGDARRFAAEAVLAGFEVIVAAGGDGTVNEVLNGMGDAPDGFARAALGVLPLGTVNVFARELKIPRQLEAAWEMLLRGRQTQIDLGCVDFVADGRAIRRYFAQLAGAGLDARAIELVSWKLKKQAGPLAYIVAGFQALAEKQPRIRARAGSQQIEGALALFGNGRLYGGPIEFFPGADLRDGMLDACLFPSLTMGSLLRLVPGLIGSQRLPEDQVRRLRAPEIELTTDQPVAFELDGEWVGHLPATFSIAPQKLRVVVP